MKRFLSFILLSVAVTSAQAVLRIQSWTLENGARVLFVENHTIPMLDVSVEFDAGARRDPDGKDGLAALTNAMLASGVEAGQGQDEPALNESQISDAFADTAAQRAGTVGSDRAGVTLRTLVSKVERDQAVALLSRILAHPGFPADQLARDKIRTVAALREDQTKPEWLANRAFWHAMYGNHPYAREASVASIESLTREDFVAFHRTHYVANRAVIAMIGDLSRAEADAVARQLSMRLPQGAPLPPIPDVPVLPGHEERIAHPASQAHILIGMPALARGDPDFFALTVGNYVLGGGGFVSRLTREVREKRGLSYSVYSYFNPMLQKGPFQLGLETQKEQTDEALKVVRDTLSAYLRDGPTVQELKAAKDNLIGGFALRIDNNRKILDNIAVIGYYGLPLDYLDHWTANVDKVSIADIRQAFSKKIALEKLTTIMVGVAP